MEILTRNYDSILIVILFLGFAIAIGVLIDMKVKDFREKADQEKKRILASKTKNRF